MMKLIFFRKILVILFIAAGAVFMSCDMFKDTDDYDINIFIICSGSGGELFNATIIIDGKTPITINGLQSQAVFPAGKISSATITATREASEDSLMILVYKDNELDEKGFAPLPTCTSSSSTTYCSDTLVLQYKVDQEDTDKTSGTAASTSTSSSSSSSSSSTSE
ncbi:MAG TPA: hypothetical protein PKN50_13215 [Spirochaetota bacterium]|nr:hypothetical protein [Spirochaetota bacterium]HPV40565.1 hypothetical protein [Spirochaetota bacterium]